MLNFCTGSHKSSSFTRRKSRTSNNPVPVLRIPSKYGWMSCSLNESNLTRLRHNSQVTTVNIHTTYVEVFGLCPARSRVVGNLRRPPMTCHCSSESWENGDSEYIICYAGKIRPFLKFQYLHNIRNYFFWPDLRRLPSQQTPNIWYVLVANMLESNPVVRNISEIHLRSGDCINCAAFPF